MTPRHRLADERGIALPMALFVLVILLSLSAAILATGSNETTISTNHLRSMQALFVAEAGLEAAFEALRANETNVTGSPPTTWTDVPSLAAPGSDITPYGTYVGDVEYKRHGPSGSNTVIVRSVGTATLGGARRTLRAIITKNYKSIDAVRTKDDLGISGSATVQGPCGSVHANGDLTLGGSQQTAVNATASGGFSDGGTTGGVKGGGFPQKSVPTISAADFLTTAKSKLPASQIYQLMSDGRILDGNDTAVTGSPVANNGTHAATGWSYKAGNPPEWSNSTGTVSATYYVQGDVKINGTSGTWTATIISTKNINLSGNPVMTPHLTDTLFIADQDIDINGTAAGVNLSGLIAAHEQIDIRGNGTITGSIIAEDAANTSNLVRNVAISGSAVITYDCGLNPPLNGPMAILAWGF